MCDNKDRFLSKPSRGVGQSGRIPNSSITTRSRKAGTLRRGNSRSSSPKRRGRGAPGCRSGAPPERSRGQR